MFLAIIAAAAVFLILYMFTVILQLRSLDPEILQKEEMVSADSQRKLC